MLKSLLIVSIVLGGLLLPLGTETSLAIPVFKDDAFANTWNRVDKPVEVIPGVGRGYIWGPVAPSAEQISSEPYEKSMRKVQYFDKARMEINNPTASSNDLFYVTTGLLAKELVSGFRQDGNNIFSQFLSSQVQVAGDPNDQGGNQAAPTYASFQKIATIVGNENRVVSSVGNIINSRIDRSGTITFLTPPENRLLKNYDSITGHNIADVFVDFSNISGSLWDGNSYQTGPVFFGNSTYVLGRPITEPFWTRAVVSGVEKDVLVQLFERRALTYTPTNPDGFKVEMGNVGQHYYRWRYFENVTSPKPVPGQKVGIEALTDLYSLPNLDPYTQTRQVSSHDPAGGNDDSAHYLYKEGDRYFIFDDLGPGAVYRIWLTAADNKFLTLGHIQFFFDNDTTPRVDLTLTDFFSGRIAPFVRPLVGNDDTSSGGYFSYVPLTYVNRLRIALTQLPVLSYYQVDCQRYQFTTKVLTFTGKEDYSRLYRQFSNPGTDPKPATANRQVIRGQSQLTSLAELDLSSWLNGPGVVTGIKLSPQESPDSFLTSAAMRVRYDSKILPQIDAPLDFFFGSGFGEKEVKGLLNGMDSINHQYYFYLPLPFRQNINISLANYTTKSFRVNWEITYEPDIIGSLVTPYSGYLNTYYHKVREPAKDKDYNVLKYKGQGKYIGAVIYLNSVKSAMEGDHRFYLDDSNSPWLPGTGFEDYFNGAWGFVNGSFSQYLHGSAFVSTPPGSNSFITLTGYRFHLGDAVNFYNSISLGFEHGYIGSNSFVQNETYRSLAFWYGIDNQALELTDTLNPTDSLAAEQSHSYNNSGLVVKGPLTAAYEGENDHSYFTDSGYVLKGGSQFKVKINPANAGVIIRRRSDYGYLNQQANIYIDGQLAGRWFSAGQNQVKRWREEDFFIPPVLTNGKSSIQVRVEVINDPSPWSEYFYWVYSLYR